MLRNRPTRVRGHIFKGSNNQTVTLPNGQDWYDIVFHVVDNDSTQKIVFDTNQPICAQVGTACPTTGSEINTNGQLSVEDSKGKKLTLQNCNRDTANSDRLHVVLR